MPKYPPEYGRPMKGVLSDFKTPLNIQTEEGDVPPNDMGAIEPRNGFPDPLGAVIPDKGKK